jgi:transposase
VKSVGVDEFCVGSGHQYNTVGVAITCDKFHFVKVGHAAMGQVRREYKELKKTRYHLPGNDQNLKEENIERRNELAELHPTIVKAFRLKSLFKDFWGFKHGEQAGAFLRQWCHAAEKSELPPFQYTAQTIQNHWQGIVHHFTSKLNNGVLEGIHNKIQLAKRRARGYRNPGKFHLVIHFIADDLRFDHPLFTT